MNSNKKLNTEIGLKWIFLFWAIVISIAFIFGGKEAAIVASVIAAISLVIQLVNRSSSWQGQVVDLYTKVIAGHVDTNEVHHSDRTAYIAKIILPNGKYKEVDYDPNFYSIKIGDKIIKERGKESWYIKEK